MKRPQLAVLAFVLVGVIALMAYFIFTRYTSFSFFQNNDLAIINSALPPGERAAFRFNIVDKKYVIEVDGTVKSIDTREKNGETETVLTMQSGDSKNSYFVGLGPDTFSIHLFNEKKAAAATEGRVVVSETLAISEILESISVGDELTFHIHVKTEHERTFSYIQNYFLEYLDESTRSNDLEPIEIDYRLLTMIVLKV